MPQIAQVVKSTFRINHIGGNCPYTLSNTTARGVGMPTLVPHISTNCFKIALLHPAYLVANRVE